MGIGGRRLNEVDVISSVVDLSYSEFLVSLDDEAEISKLSVVDKLNIDFGSCDLENVDFVRFVTNVLKRFASVFLDGRARINLIRLFVEALIQYVLGNRDKFSEDFLSRFARYFDSVFKKFDMDPERSFAFKNSDIRKSFEDFRDERMRDLSLVDEWFNIIYSAEDFRDERMRDLSLVDEWFNIIYSALNGDFSSLGSKKSELGAVFRYFNEKNLMNDLVLRFSECENAEKFVDYLKSGDIAEIVCYLIDLVDDAQKGLGVVMSLTVQQLLEVLGTNGECSSVNSSTTGKSSDVEMPSSVAAELNKSNFVSTVSADVVKEALGYGGNGWEVYVDPNSSEFGE